MIEMIIKLLIVMFTLFVGVCFAVWPREVSRKLDKWRGRSVESAEDRGRDIRKTAAVFALRQMGALLIALACYVVYLWIKLA